MDNNGPVTQRRIRIKQQIETVGRKLGIPEGNELLVAKIVEIDAIEQMTEAVNSLHADETKWHQGKGFDFLAFLRTIAATIVGEIDSHKPKK